MMMAKVSGQVMATTTSMFTRGACPQRVIRTPIATDRYMRKRVTSMSTPFRLILVRPLDAAGFTLGGAVAEPVQRLLELGDGEGVLATTELGSLVVFEAIDCRLDGCLDETAVRLETFAI